MSRVPMGSRGPFKGAADSSGLNPGNWTVSVTPDLLNSTVAQFEVYKILVDGAAPGAKLSVFIDIKPWDTNIYAPSNAWAPTTDDELILRPGQTLNFCFSSPATDSFQPEVTLWMRYDPVLALSTPNFYGVT